MRWFHRLGRPSPAMVVASVALFVALSGTAIGDSAFTAARGLVTGKNIKNGSVTGRDIKNGSVLSADVRDGSLLAKDFKAGQLPSTKAGGDLTGTYPAPTIVAGAVKSQTVADRSLTLSDLGGSRKGELTTTTAAAISIGAGQCAAQQSGNFGDGVVGDLVIGTLTDAAGNAVLPNTAAFVPSIVIKTNQGGAVPNLIVCNTGNAALTIPAGSVFHWRLIDA